MKSRKAGGHAVNTRPNSAVSPRSFWKRPVFWVIAVLAMGTSIVAADYWRSPLPASTVAKFVGRQTCAECHAQEVALHRDSHHDLAMDHATEQTVLGDFNDVTFEHHGIISRMYRDGSRFMIHTEGPTGAMENFEVKYVFGVHPLQQYMVEFDRTSQTPDQAIARLQVLRISWDVEGKRWFYLAPPDVPERLTPDDDLHWTGIAQRWNTMCAECHSTNLKKNYDPTTQSYATTYSEIDVSCESCHGPASTHVELASRVSLFWDRNLGYGLANLKGEDIDLQIQACAPCHSRRGIVAGGFQAGDAYCDFYDPSPLREMLYHADGQILDEVYVYGSFTQSKMYHKGIRCTDCHDPHSLQLKAPGNQVCTSCHQHPAGKYDTPSHHKHVPGKAGSACVDCHMPATTYMAVDPRRDHSLRVPRPDLSVRLGTPNACTGCHLEPNNISEETRSTLGEYADWLRLATAGDEQVAAEVRRANQWCDEACEKWYGKDRYREPHFAEAIHAYRSQQPDAAEQLLNLARQTTTMPAIARTTALDALAALNGPNEVAARVTAGADSLDDPSPMVRAAAVRAAAAPPRDERDQQRIAQRLAPLLADPSRLVRSTAARELAQSGTYRLLDSNSAGRFQLVLNEIEQGLEEVSDRAGAHMDWALLCEALGRVNEAVESYQIAMQVEPRMVGPRSNLAGLLENVLQAKMSRGQIDNEEMIQTQRVITNLRKQELPLMERDASLAPDNAMIQYRLGMAYYLNGKLDMAIKSLERAYELDPNPDFETALRLMREK